MGEKVDFVCVFCVLVKLGESFNIAGSYLRFFNHVCLVKAFEANTGLLEAGG
jgi:hypothetical protein